MSENDVTIEVIPWPTLLHAIRDYPSAGWWVIERRDTGITPVAGPFRTKEEAEEKKATY